MSDLPDGQLPDKGWLGGLPSKAKGWITTAEFAGALTCAGVALSLGGDMTLTAIALSAGWVLGSIGVATVSDKSVVWKGLIIAALFVFFVAEGGFLYWHFQSKIIEAALTPTFQPEQRKPQQPVADTTTSRWWLRSNLKKVILLCDKSKTAKPQSLKDKRAAMARHIDLMKKIFGQSATGEVTEDEVTLTVDIPLPHGKIEQTWLRKKVNDQIFVSVTNESDDWINELPLKIFSIIPINPDGTFGTHIREKVEDFAKIDRGKCKFL